MDPYYLFFALNYNPIIGHLFSARIVLALAVGSSLKLVSVPFHMSVVHVCDTSLLFGIE